jgi:hypothetical protein
VKCTLECPHPMLQMHVKLLLLDDRWHIVKCEQVGKRELFCAG